MKKIASDKALPKMLDKSLDKVLSLRPVTWNWKSEKDGTEVQFGFIAQEVAKVIPHLVTDGTWNDGTTRKFINTGDMIPYLVSAIKEQQEQIEQLQTSVKKLEKILNSK
jgi:hypothetical protein